MLLSMNNFTTVYLFTNTANGIFAENLFFQRVGFFAVAIGILILFTLFPKRKDSRTQISIILVGIYVSLGACFFVLSMLSNSADKQRYQQLLQMYNNQQYQIAEGTVHLIKPSYGREHGDFINVGGTDFEIGSYSYPYGSYGYMNTIANGGILKEEVYAKIYYIDDVIIRIDIKSSDFN